MSFPLQQLLGLYTSHGDDGSLIRGHGAEALVAFLRLLEIPQPLTCDLSHNIVMAVAKHIRRELKPELAEPMITDIHSFLAFIYPHWTPNDYSQAVTPDPKFVALVKLAERHRLGRS